MYIVESSNSPAPQVLRLSAADARFEPGDWPSGFGELREELQQAGPRTDVGEVPGSVGAPNASAAQSASVELADRFYSGGALEGWQFEPRVPALVRSIAADHDAGVLLIDHNIALIMDTCDRIQVLDQGTVLAEGAPAEIRANLDVAAAYLGETPVPEE